MHFAYYQPILNSIKVLFRKNRTWALKSNKQVHLERDNTLCFALQHDPYDDDENNSVYLIELDDNVTSSFCNPNHDDSDSLKIRGVLDCLLQYYRNSRMAFILYLI